MAESQRRQSGQRHSELSIGTALEVLRLLASSLPAGLTIPEIILRLRRPVPDVIRTIAVMQRRHWVQSTSRGAFSIGRCLRDLADEGQD